MTPPAGNTNYKLTVTTGVRDLAGNSVGLTKDFSFKTLNTLSPNFSASGTVTGPGGSPLSGVSLLVSLISQSGTAKQIVVTDASGHYSANQLLNGQYIIVPSLAGTIFSPQSITTAITNASVSGLNFFGAPIVGSSIIINGGATFTRSASVTLALIAPSNAGAVTQMQFSKDGVNFFPFEPFATTRVVTLLPGDGLKTITVRFKDAAGNVSARISDSITLDTTAPTGIMAINGGAAFTRSASVTLSLTAVDTVGVTQMQFSNDGGVKFFPFEPFAATRVATLLPGDGAKTLAVRFKDAAGNVSPTITASITLDTVPPTGTIAFPIGATTTSVFGVLALTATDASGVNQMQFSKNGSAFFALEPFSTSRTVTLEKGRLNSLTVRFKDAAGNLSAPQSATITRTP